MRGHGWGLLDTASVLLGALVLWGVLGASGYVLGWTLHQHHAGQALVRQARQELAELAVSHPLAGCHELNPASGQLLGILVIPSLHLTAPIEQGTSNAVLAVAVGHDPQSVLPGRPGASALLAHDVSYFVNIDQLHPGEQIDVAMPCKTVIFSVSRHEVVRSGSAVPGSVQPTLVLDTCWPTNALWFTPTRYLVFAREAGVTQTSPEAPQQTGIEPSNALRNRKQLYANLAVPVPRALASQGLTLVDNETPMGRMKVIGSPSTSYTQSPAPLNVERAALEAYFAAWHSIAQDRPDWWSSFAPNVPFPASLAGARIVSHQSGLDVTENVRGETALSVTLSTLVGLSGPSAGGNWTVRVTESIHGNELTISNWEVSPS